MVPNDVHIYVKEHPRQAIDNFDVAKIHFRDPAFYESISKLPNVSFLSTKVDSEDIIKNASLVATCCGSALWEALLKGIPTLAFGFCWHEKCASTLRYKNIEETSKDLLQLLSKSRDQVIRDLKDFIITNSNYFVTTTFGELMAKEMVLDNVKLSENFAFAILQMLDRYTKENGKRK